MEVIISNRLSVPDRISYFKNLWTEYWSGVWTGFGTDLLIVAAAGVEVRAHQSVLLPLSPFLSELLQSSESCECHGNICTLHLPDRNPDDISRLLQLLYTGSCLISDRSMYNDLVSLMFDIGLVIPGQKLTFIPVTQATQNYGIELHQMLNNNWVYDAGTTEKKSIKTEFGKQNKEPKREANFKCINCAMEFLPNKPVSYIIHERACNGGVSLKFEEPEPFSCTQIVGVEEDVQNDVLVRHNSFNDLPDINLQQDMNRDQINEENAFNIDENFTNQFNCYICDQELDSLSASVYLHYSVFHFSEELLSDFSDRVVDDKCLDCGTELETLNTPHWFLVHMGVKHKRVEKYLPPNRHIGSDPTESSGCSPSKDNNPCGEDSLMETNIIKNHNGGSNVNNQMEGITTMEEEEFNKEDITTKREEEFNKSRHEVVKQDVFEDSTLEGNVTNGFDNNFQVASVNPEIRKMMKKCFGIKGKVKVSKEKSVKLKKLKRNKHKRLISKKNQEVRVNKKNAQEKCDKKVDNESEYKKCSICSKEFKKNLQLRFHYSRLHFKNELGAEITPLFVKNNGSCLKDGCFKTFKSQKSFINHMGATHREVDKYVCQVKAPANKKMKLCRATYRNCPRCDKKTRAYNTGKHMVKHYFNELTELLKKNDEKDGSSLLCSHCGEQFEDINDLVDHAVESHNVLSMVCTDEELKFTKGENAHNTHIPKSTKGENDHNIRNTLISKSRAKECGDPVEIQDLPITLKKKVSSQIKFSGSNKTPRITRSDPNKCKICRKQVRNSAVLLQHVSSHFSKELSKEFSEDLSQPGPQITCPKCHKFVLKKSFVKHIGSLHKEVVKYAPWINFDQSQNKRNVKFKKTGLSKDAGESLGKTVAPIYEFTDEAIRHDPKMSHYKSGDLVFVQLGDLPPWPAKVVSNTWLGVDVCLFALNNVGTAKNNKIWPYNDENLKQFTTGQMGEKFASQFEQGLKEIEATAKSLPMTQFVPTINNKRRSSKQTPRCSQFPSNEISVGEHKKENAAAETGDGNTVSPTEVKKHKTEDNFLLCKTNGKLQLTPVSSSKSIREECRSTPGDGNPSEKMSEADSQSYPKKYSCPFDDCDFQTDYEGMKSGPAAHHAIQIHNTPPWEMKKHGLKFKRVPVEKSAQALPSQIGKEIKDDEEMAQVRPTTESAEATNPQSTSSIDEASNIVGQAEREWVSKDEEGDHVESSSDVSNLDNIYKEGVVPMDHSPVCTPSKSLSPEY